MTSTFGVFTVARLGILAASQGLNVTGNNIANINTDGYTRQQLDQFSLHVGSSDKFQSGSTAKMGSGVLAPSVSHSRDIYLDIRYRNANANVGQMEAKLNGLDHLSTIMDEVTKGEDGEGVLEGLFNDAISQMNGLASQGAGKDQFDSLFRSSMSALVHQINKEAVDLQNLQATMSQTLTDDVAAANSLIDRIRDLNTTIRRNQIYGDSSLEQQDARDALLDELSKYLSLDITYAKEQVSLGLEVDRLVVHTGTEPPRLLVDGIFAANLRERPNAGDDLGPVDESGIPVTGDDAPSTFPATDAGRLAANELAENLNKDEAGYEYRVQTDPDTGEMTIHQYALNYDLNLSDLVDVNGVPRIVKEIDMGAVKNRDAGAVDADGLPVEESGNPQATFATVEAAEARAAELNENAAGTEFRVVVEQPDGEEGETTISIHEFTTTVYLSKDDALMALEETQQDLSTHVNPTTGEITQYYYKVMEMDEGSGTYEVRQFDLFRGAVQLGDTELGGKLLSDREILTEKGSYAMETDLERDPDAAGKRGIPYYRHALDTLANHLAKTLNEANQLQDEDLYVMQGGEYVDAEGKPTTDPSKYVVRSEYANVFQVNVMGQYVDESGNPTTDPGKYVLKPEYSYLKNSTLLSNHPNTNYEDHITAKNISISKNWDNGSFRVNRSLSPDAASTDNSNLSHIYNLLNGNHSFMAWDSEIYPAAANSEEAIFSGTYQAFLTDHVSANLAGDRRTTTTMLNNYTMDAEELYINRDGVVGVDLNDEAMSIMKYQKSYSASCRLMTAFDEMLDRLINGTAL